MSASISASAPIRVRFRGRTSWSIALRACSTAAALAVPSFGTWLRRCGASAGVAVAAGLAGSSPLVIVIVLRPSVRSAPRPPEHAKTLATRRGSLRSSVVGASVALVPPRSSVLPPGAGNEEPKKALKPGKERAKKVEERYVAGIEVAHGHGDAAPIGRHDDGDAVPAVTLEEVQATQLLYTRWWRSSRSVAPGSVRAQPPQLATFRTGAGRRIDPDPRRGSSVGSEIPASPVQPLEGRSMSLTDSSASVPVRPRLGGRGGRSAARAGAGRVGGRAHGPDLVEPALRAVPRLPDVHVYGDWTVSHRLTTYFTADGTPTRDIELVTFSGRFVNPDTGAWVPDSGRVVYFDTLDADFNYLSTMANSQRTSAYVHGAGRRDFQLDTFRGHDGETSVNVAALCAALGD